MFLPTNAAEAIARIADADALLRDEQGNPISLTRRGLLVATVAAAGAALVPVAGTALAAPAPTQVVQPKAPTNVRVWHSTRVNGELTVAWDTVGKPTHFKVYGGRTDQKTWYALDYHGKELLHRDTNQVRIGNLYPNQRYGFFVVAWVIVEGRHSCSGGVCSSSSGASAESPRSAAAWITTNGAAHKVNDKWPFITATFD